MSLDNSNKNLPPVLEDINSEIKSSNIQSPKEKILNSQQSLKKITYDLNQEKEDNIEKEENIDKEEKEEKEENIDKEEKEENIEKEEKEEKEKNEKSNENSELKSNSLDMDSINKLLKEIENEKINHIENIKQLKNKLNKQTKNVQNLTFKNSNLRASLQDLNYEMDKIIKKSSGNRLKLKSPQKSLEIINNEIKNSKTLENILLKDNIRIKKLIEYQTQITINELENKIKEKKIENDELKKELKQLKNIHISHLKCELEKTELKRKIKEIELEILRQKESSYKIKNNFENLEQVNQKSNIAFNRFKENIKQRKLIEEKKKLQPIKISFENSKLNDDYINKLKEDITSLSKDEIKIIEDYYKENQNKFEEFLRKVFYIEKYFSHRKNEEQEIEKENDDNYNEKIEELNSLEKNIKEKEEKIQLFEIQVSDFKNSKISLQKKFESISNSIKQMNKKINIKEKENAELFIEISNLSKILKEKKYDPSNKIEMNSILMKDAATNYDFENENINGNNNI